MKKIEVMSLETLSPESFNDAHITYRDKIINRDVVLTFEFVKFKLIGAYYSFTTLNSRDYLNIRKLLQKKYGPPLESRDAGPSNYLFLWKTKTTMIELKPGKARRCRVEYNSLKLQHLIFEVQEDREKEILKLF